MFCHQSVNEPPMNCTAGEIVPSTSLRISRAGALGMPSRLSGTPHISPKPTRQAANPPSGPKATDIVEEIPGIGPFTAQVIAMRVLRDPDAFPENDLFVLRRLGANAVRRAERWRPFRAYAVMHLWEDEGAKR